MITRGAVCYLDTKLQHGWGGIAWTLTHHTAPRHTVQPKLNQLIPARTL